MAQRAPQDRHVPVMLERCTSVMMQCLGPVAEDGRTPVVIDATLGLGGHSQALLEATAASASPAVQQAQIIGIDRDPQALEAASQRLAPFTSRFTAVRAVYHEIPQIAQQHVGAGSALAGVLFDLGVSSLQLDEKERGFAYSYDAPLDMRMDSAEDSADETAAELLERIDEQELRRVLREYGEERFASRIARSIMARQQQAPITTTAELAELVDAAVPAAAKRTGGHPAKRTFQALRIAVNRELDVLREAVPAAMDELAIGGRVVAMSYHSLEDRIVKQAFAARTNSSAPAGLPVELEQHKATFRPVIRGVEVADEEEVSLNPRASSAKLRSVEKIRSTARSTA